MMHARLRNIIAVIEEGEEELECNHINADLNTRESSPKKDGHQEFIAEFCDVEDEETLISTTFALKNSINDVVWNILPYGECLKWDDMKYEDKTWKKGVELSDDTVLNAFLFEDFFPFIKGHARLIDDYYSSRNYPFYSTFRNDQIKFYDEDADDLEHLVKIACKIMISAVYEVDQSVENFWKRGRSNYRLDCPNFGRYMSKNMFKAFQSAAPYCFAEKKHWCVDKRDRPWKIFLP